MVVNHYDYLLIFVADVVFLTTVRTDFNPDRPILLLIYILIFRIQVNKTIYYGNFKSKE